MNVNSPVQSEKSELRLVRAACVIEMHYRSVSPAGSGAAAIVHGLTAIGPQEEAAIQRRARSLSVNTKDDNRSNAACVGNLPSNKLELVLITNTRPTQGPFVSPADTTSCL